MLDFLPFSFTSVPHQLSGSGANSFISDGTPNFSISDHGTFDATTAPPALHIASSCKIQQADFTAQASLTTPSSLFVQFGKRKDSFRSSFRNSFFSFPENKRRSLSSSSFVPRKKSGQKKEALKTLVDSSPSESESINGGTVSSQSKQKMDPLEPLISSLTRRPVRAAQRQSSIQSTSEPPSITRFPFSSRSVSVQESSSDSPSDEFIDLNIQATLFLTGQAGSYSPAAFNSLAKNAERLLSRLQAAYKGCKMSLREVTMEKETQAEELEGCQMRVRHLQMQLDKMTAQFAEQDQGMKNLVDGLVQEKQSQQKQQEHGTPKRGTGAMTATRADLRYHKPPGNSEIIEARRGSDISTRSVISDSGFESDEESPTNTVGVKHQDAPSPSASVSSISPINSKSRDLSCVTNLPPPTLSYPPATAQPPRPKASSIRVSGRLPSTQRNPAWSSSSTLRNPFETDTSCSNCQGVRASEAWNVVNVLQEENRGLKERLGHLESSLDGCLDLVTSLIENGRITTT